MEPKDTDGDVLNGAKLAPATLAFAAAAAAVRRPSFSLRSLRNSASSDATLRGALVRCFDGGKAVTRTKHVLAEGIEKVLAQMHSAVAGMLQ